MANNRNLGVKDKEYPYPSRFGSHASMINMDGTKKLIEDGKDALIALQDESGVYVTERNRLDNGMADPNRYESSRLRILHQDEEKDKKKKERKKKK